jgi:signal transduction histidine kinase
MRNGVMLKQKILIVTENENNLQGFAAQVQEQLGHPVVYTPMTFLQAVLPETQDEGIQANLLILFADYGAAGIISRELREKLTSDRYLLISVGDSRDKELAAMPDLFDWVELKAGSRNLQLLFRRIRNEVAARQRIAYLQSEVTEFYEIGKSLSSEKDTLILFEKIINSSIRMTSSDAGTIFLVIDRDSGSWSTIKDGNYTDKLLKFAIARNMSRNIDLEASTAEIMGESIFGYTVITGRPLRIENAYEIPPSYDYKLNQSYDRSTGYMTRSILTVPMKDHANNVMGVIQLINKKKRRDLLLDSSSPESLENIIPYDFSDELIMNSLAGQAAVALENNLLYRETDRLLDIYRQQNRELEHLSKEILKAHEEERKRIAREIHDGPAQSVVNLSLKLDLCKKFYQMQDDERLTTGFNELNTGIRSAAKEIRTIIYDLKPSYLEDGIVQALANHFEIFGENTGIKVDFRHTSHPAQLEYYLTSTLYRIVQEAFSNIAKHAGATHVKVGLNIGQDGITLDITDNGKGFDIQILRSGNLRSLKGGFGMEGMIERVKLVKGTIDIKSEPGKGTRISIKVPVK